MIYVFTVDDPGSQSRRNDAVVEKFSRMICLYDLVFLFPCVDSDVVLENLKCGRMEIKLSVYLVRKAVVSVWKYLFQLLLWKSMLNLS